jgi:D-aspartate ligase
VTTTISQAKVRPAGRRATVRGLRASPVHVFDADAPTALAFVRSLGRAGVPVVVCSHNPAAVARFSRYASGFKRCPPVDDAGAFRPWLEEQLASGRIRVVAPTSDVLCFHLAELRHLLPRPVQDALPSTDAFLDCLMKDRFERALARVGARAPAAWCPASVAEARVLAETLPYPVVLKPKSHVGVNLRGLVVRSADELLASYAAYEMPADHADVVERFPGIELPMIQEYVPGALENLYSVSGLVGKDGRVAAIAASKKTSQWPPSLGVGLLFESCTDERVIELGAAIAEDVVGRGLFELELIHDARTDSFLAIDLNPRAYGQIALDVARGNDLPLLWYKLAVGETIERIGAARRVARFVHGVPYTLEQVIGLVRGPARAKRLAAWANVLRKAHVDIVNDARDPLPSLPYTAHVLRHPGSLLRGFLGQGR